MFRFVRNPDARKKPPYGSRIDPTHPLAQGLVGCWLLNEGGGNVIYDISGRGYNGSGSGFPTWTDESIKFNAANSDAFDCGKINMGGWKELSFLFRFICTDKAADRGMLGNGSYDRASYYIEYQTLDRCNIVFNTDDGENNLYVWGLGTNIPYDICGVFDNGNVAMYLNRTQSNTDSFGTQLNPVDAPNNYYIGYDPRKAQYFTGHIFYHFLWNRALHANEVSQLYAEPYSFILVPQYWYMVDFGAITGGSLIKIINEQIQVSEALSKRGSTKKVVNENLELNENISRISGVIKVINETLHISELIAKIPGITKVINETLQFSESVFRKTGITKVVNEALQIVENISKRAWTTKIVNEALNLSESVFKRGVVKKIVNETLQLSENVIRRSGLVRIINETLRISENIIRSLAVALGWREVLEADSLITLEVSKKSAITIEISDNSPLD